MIHFFTYITDDKKENAEIFLQSVEKQKININILSEKVHLYNARKLVCLKEAIKPLPDDAIIVFTDSFDVLYIQSEEVIYQKFIKSCARLLFNAEHGGIYIYNQNREYYNKFKDKSFSRYRYFNSGAFIGYKDEIEKMLHWCVTDENFKNSNKWMKKIYSDPGSKFISDQYIIIDYVMTQPNEIKLDYDCDIFWNFAFDYKRFNNINYIKDGKLYNSITNSDPCILHFPGHSDRISRYHRIIKKINHELYAKQDSNLRPTD